MHEEPPTPFDTVGDEPVEARIVAWVLGEASAFEAAELERLCEERPELLVFRRRMRALHGLLTEAESAEPDHSWKLPPERRRMLDEIFGEENVVQLDSRKEQSIRHSSRRAFLAIAACLLLTVIVAGLFASGGAGIQKARKHTEGGALVRYENSTLGSEAGGNSEAARQSLDKAIREQEEKVEERRKALATTVRTKGIIYKGQDSFYGQSGVDEDQGARGAAEVSKDHTREEAIKGGLDAQDYADAKREFESDQQLLQQLKLKQIELAAASGGPDETLARNDDAQSRRWHSTPGQSGKPPAAPVGRTASASKTESLASRLDRKAVANESEKQPASAAAADSFALADSALPAQAAAPAVELAMRLPERDVRHSPRGINEDEDIVSQSRSGINMNRRFGTDRDVAVTSVDDIPADPSQFGSDGATSGLRSGDQAITRNNVDAILNNPNRPEAQGLAKARGIKSESAAKPPVLADKESGLSDDSANSDRMTEEAHGRFNLIERFDAGDSDASPPVMGEKFTTYAGMSIPAPITGTSAYLLSQVDSASEFAVPEDGPALEKEGKPVLKEREQKLATLRKQLEEPSLADSKKQALFSEWQKLNKEINKMTFDEPLAELEVAQVKITDLVEEIAASENPYSTFSLNISDASFQLAKAALAKGERPDPASIKPEQFYNAVDYGDPAPASNEPVAATIEQSAHPVIPGRNLVRVALRTGSVGRSAAQPLRLTLLVDQSGSMVREDRRASMEHALSQLGVLLTKADLVTVIGFSRTPHLLADGMTGDQAAKLGELVNQTASEGGTNLEEAMKLGGAMAARHQLAGAQNRIVLFTDGAANLGDANPDRLAEQVKALRQKGIAFDIAGIGADGLNDRLLSELARNGNGRYYVVGEEKNDSFARQLAGAFRPAAENVKVQVNFNPQRVGKYKLIGFEKDRLKTEDFRNDAVDAAELAAEEAGVAIYQVEPLAEGSGELGEVSVRFRDAGSKEMVERTWTISYDAQATAFDRATPSMQLAGLSLLAAEKLRGGPLADAIDFKQLSGPSAFVKQFYGSSPRVSEMLQVIEKLK